MDRTEILFEFTQSYNDLVAYLLKKYGPAKYDFFPNEKCCRRSKRTTRTNEGLYCHHIDEDKGGNLANPVQAAMQPFAWQRKERLVYCNILEHLILHIKIMLMRQQASFEEPRDVFSFFTTDGTIMICHDLNDMFMLDGTEQPWRKNCFQPVKENYSDYIIILHALFKYIELNVPQNADHSLFLQIGSIIHTADGDCEILKMTPKRDILCIKLPSGKELSVYSTLASNQLTFFDYIDMYRRILSSGYESFYTSIYHDLITDTPNDDVSKIVKSFSIDFGGYGFPEYTDFLLSESYGAKNADQYISKALPMYSNPEFSLNGKTPVFLQGPFPDGFERNGKQFYIVRIRTTFDLKENSEAFLRYRESDIYRRKYDFTVSENRNLLHSGWTVLSTSKVIDPKTGEKYDYYYKADQLVKATLDISLGRDDFLLFFDRYNIHSLEILNGCYFV